MNFIYLIFGFLLLFFVIIFIRYRLSFSNKILIESEVKFVMIDIGYGDYFRNGFESLLGNRRIFLKDENLFWAYFPNKEINLLIKNNILDLKEKKKNLFIEI